MPDKILRTFLAVELPVSVKKTATGLRSKVVVNGQVVKWVKRDNIHLTLRFIGPTPESEVPKIGSLISKVVANHNDISIYITGTGVFPKPRRPRILWLGVDGEVEKLKNLVNEINSALNSIGYPTEKRKYEPHITIGRINYPQNVTPDVTNFINSNYDPIPVEVQTVKFMQSDLVPGGPIYSTLGVYQLTP